MNAPDHLLTVHKLTTFTRNGAGGNPVYVVVEPEPLSSSQRQAVARDLGLLTAFLPATTPDPIPAVFFDPEGERAVGEQALIAVFRTLALTGRTIARRVRIDTVRRVVPVQEEVFRKPNMAQVWIEVELPQVDPMLEPLTDLRARLLLPPHTRSWRSGPTWIVDGGSLEQVRTAKLEPDLLRALLPEGLSELLLYTLESSSPFSDIHARHVTTRGAGQELPASVEANAALGSLLWQGGIEKPFLLIEQGGDAGQPSRVSVWIEGEGPLVMRVSVGGKVAELERFERSWPQEAP